MVTTSIAPERTAAPGRGTTAPGSGAAREDAAVVPLAVEQPPQDDPGARAWAIAAEVVDPEIPVLTIEDLGVLRAVAVDDDRVRVQLTPTYSGCPAIDAMRDDVRDALLTAGFTDVAVELVLSPAWTTDWMTAAGREKLRRFGITPPSGLAPARGTARGTAPGLPVRVTFSVKCPRCDSLNTRELARFGSTSCKALYECRDCSEPFDYFKVL